MSAATGTFGAPQVIHEFRCPHPMVRLCARPDPTAPPSHAPGIGRTSYQPDTREQAQTLTLTHKCSYSPSALSLASRRCNQPPRLSQSRGRQPRPPRSTAAHLHCPRFSTVGSQAVSMRAFCETSLNRQTHTKVSGRVRTAWSKHRPDWHKNALPIELAMGLGRQHRLSKCMSEAVSSSESERVNGSVVLAKNSQAPPA